MRRPSVLFINRVYPPKIGATGRVLSDLARSFAREGWQVTVITTGEKTLTERDGAVRVIRVKASQDPSPRILAYIWIWMKLLFVALRLPATNLVVTMTDPPLLVLAGQVLKKFKKNHHMHWCQDLYPDLLPALGAHVPSFLVGFVKKLSRKAMREADRVVVIGRCMAKRLAHEGFDAADLTMIPNWPDLELVQDKPANDQDTNLSSENFNGVRSHDEQLKHDAKFRVLYAGNLGLAHPIETVLNAAEQLNGEHPEIEFVFVGEGPKFDRLAKERSRRHLQNIRLLPYQPNSRLKELMESGDLHLISMKDEAAGMLVPSKFYAAVAAHRPCLMVGPRNSETAKVIHDFRAGMVVPQGSPEQLAEEIRQFRLNSDKWFQAYEGAQEAAKVFVPQDAINAWIDRAWSIVEHDVKSA